MKVLFYLLAAIVGLLGITFLAGNQGVVLRIVVGIVLLATAIALVIAARLRPQVEQRNIVQKIDLSGDITREELSCPKCGAGLDQQAISVVEGAVMASCPYCKTTTQLEEAPKW
jgi:Zn finger protein HypA/HybF involved in hydrogenase expression